MRFEKENADTEFGINWAVAKDWSESSRYECNIEETRAHDLFNAVAEIKSAFWLFLSEEKTWNFPEIR